MKEIAMMFIICQVLALILEGFVLKPQKAYFRSSPLMISLMSGCLLYIGIVTNGFWQVAYLLLAVGHFFLLIKTQTQVPKDQRGIGFDWLLKPSKQKRKTKRTSATVEPLDSNASYEIEHVLVQRNEDGTPQAVDLDGEHISLN